ncbi:ankyrin repeat domain-containing protein [Marinifilum sp. RC60d5]|uniref:ankyrin repeat domain-containing protein n=1 Tax=Marinifilum sp. RC60d5 TaxID=3458414 RepID=UPI004035DE3C
MNKLQLLTAVAVMGLLACGCNSKSSKSDGNTNNVVKQSSDVSQFSFDNDLIMQSALDGKMETVKEALENGFDVNFTDSNKRTPLMLAAYNGHFDIVKLLIENGADLNNIDNVNRTALMYASTGSFERTVGLLLQSGAKPNMVDSEENWTAAMMAASEGQLEVLKVLVSYGADLKMVDVDNESSLDFAIANGHPEVAEYIKTQIK